MTRFKEFKNKKVLVMGLGLHGGGVGIAKFFAKQGANVLVTDLKTKEQLAESLEKLRNNKNIKYALGGHKEEDFTSADLIIKNPDVPNSSPYLQIAKKHNVPVETDITLFLKLSKAFIIGVTGTKGKTTTSSLIFHILKSLPAGRQENPKNVFLAGNIGVSPLELLPKISAQGGPASGGKKRDIVILELSSFGLENLTQGPQIAVITNIMEDHLNRYENMAEYVEAKKNIFKFQTEKDILILNKEDYYSPNFAKTAKSKIIYFSSEPGIAQNISAAIKTAEVLGISQKNIQKAIKTFKGVPSRQEFIKEIKGVKYFNDTTATMPEAVSEALKVFSEKFPKAKIILIAGGQNKGLSYNNLSEIIKQKVGELVLLPGSASEKIKENLVEFKNMHEVTNMSEAVTKAKSLAIKGDIVLLSPGAASFNIFKNEFDRGDQFVKFVKKIK